MTDHPAEAATRENCDYILVPRGYLSCVEGVLEESKKNICPTESNFDDDMDLCIAQTKAALSAHQQQGAEITRLISSFRARAERTRDTIRTLSHDSHSRVVLGEIAKEYDEAADALSRPPQPDTVTEALAKYDAQVEAAGPCSDGNCMIRKPIGQHTNGGCRCAGNSLKAQRMMIAGRELRAALAARGEA